MAGSYMEEVFQRAERKFTNIDAQLGWLSSFEDKPGNDYEKDAVKVAEVLQKGIEITKEAKKSRSFKELGILFTEADNLKFRKDEPLGTINERIRILEGEADEFADTIKSSRSFSEVTQATENLRELNPKKLGGIKSGQVRFRGSKKEQALIGRNLGFIFGEE